jgi:hypothetical protein
MNIHTSFACHNNKTPLCELMNKYGSDKGQYANYNCHNYTSFYHALFSRVRNQPLHIFELGLGTHHLDVPSNMGPNGNPGASLRAWRDYFPNAQIYGADIDTRILFQEERIQTFACDQNSPESIAALWSTHFPTTSFDILIEDGLHTFEANVCFFENSIHKLQEKGVYIIEDIHFDDIPKFEDKVQEWKCQWPSLDIRLLKIPHYNKQDNNLLVAQKKV